MIIKANNAALKSWINVNEDSDFPIQNLPFGVFSIDKLSPRIGVAIGNYILDLKCLFELGYLKNLGFTQKDFDNCYLNDMMMHGKSATRDLRDRISNLLNIESEELKNNDKHKQKYPEKNIRKCMKI